MIHKLNILPNHIPENQGLLDKIGRRKLIPNIIKSFF